MQHGGLWWPVEITKAVMFEKEAIVDEFGSFPDTFVNCPDEDGYSFDTAYVLIGWGEWPIMKATLSSKHADNHLILTDVTNEAERQRYANVRAMMATQ